MTRMRFISSSAGERSPTWRNIPPIPGIIFKMPLMLPSLPIISICFMKSSTVNLPFSRFFIMRSASFSSMFSCAFSTKVTTSPISKIRLAKRSGWKSSRSAIFSPSEMKRIGTPVTCLIERAAPPRASESILERTTPVSPTVSWKLLATFTASCPVMASATNKTSGFSEAIANFTSLICCMSASSTCKRAAVSMITTSLCRRFASAMASRAISFGCFDKSESNQGISICFASVIN